MCVCVCVCGLCVCVHAFGLLVHCSKLSSFAFKEAQVYAQENNLLFMETSALTAQNATEIFVAVGVQQERVVISGRMRL